MTIDLGAAKQVALSVKANLLPRFFQLLGHGVHLEVQVGCSLKDLLCDQLGIAPEYLDHRIQTIFLNAKPVDDVADSTAGPGATIALSAAMPGLVGAVMRKGGRYATLRQAISYGSAAACPAAVLGTVKLKLFNLVAAELGPSFLGRGVGIRGEDFRDFVSRQADALTQGCVQVQVNRESIGLQKMLDTQWGAAPVMLTVETAAD